MSNICTNIDQSKKLIELGIDVNTADMWYQHIGYSITDGKEKPTYFPMVIRDNISDDDIPAWSLSALLNLLRHPYLYNTLYNGWRCDSSCKNGEYKLGPSYTDNPLDAAFEMVCWLKENNKI